MFSKIHSLGDDTYNMQKLGKCFGIRCLLYINVFSLLLFIVYYYLIIIISMYYYNVFALIGVYIII